MAVPQPSARTGRPPRATRLRVAVALILLWWIPVWALGPLIAGWLSGPDNSPSVGSVTIAIIVVQTIIGVIGLWLGGTEIKAIVRHTTRRHALSAIWSVLLHGEIPDRPPAGPADEDRPPQGQDTGTG
jgi:hypothetical protein